MSGVGDGGQGGWIGSGRGLGELWCARRALSDREMQGLSQKTGLARKGRWHKRTRRKEKKKRSSGEKAALRRKSVGGGAGGSWFGGGCVRVCVHH